jgi:hypothetical protein
MERDPGHAVNCRECAGEEMSGGRHFLFGSGTCPFGCLRHALRFTAGCVPLYAAVEGCRVFAREFLTNFWDPFSVCVSDSGAKHGQVGMES